MGEIVFHIVLIIIMSIFFKESLTISTGRAADPIGPAGFPQALLIAIIILLIISLYFSIRKRKIDSGRSISNKVNAVYFGLLAVVVAFIFLNDIIGFTLASIFFCFSLFYMLGQKRNLKMVINAIIIGVLFTIVFGRILSVPLPRGIGLIQEFSYMLY